MSNNTDVATVRKLTMEIFGYTDPKDVEYITEEYLAQDFQDEVLDDTVLMEEDEKGIMRTTFYVHDIAYNGNHYVYSRGNGSRAQACSHANRKRVPFNGWSHRDTGQRCSHGGGNHRNIGRIYST